MMKLDVSTEIIFRTARSGGKGGQNVNKVESMVTGNFFLAGSALLSDDQKLTIAKKLSNKISLEGLVQVKSQVHRSQLENKAEVVRKMNELLTKALQKQKIRLKTKPGKAAIDKRIDSKKKNALIKLARRKVLND